MQLDFVNLFYFFWFFLYFPIKMNIITRVSLPSKMMIKFVLLMLWLLAFSQWRKLQTTLFSNPKPHLSLQYLGYGCNTYKQISNFYVLILMTCFTFSHKINSSPFFIVGIQHAKIYVIFHLNIKSYQYWINEFISTMSAAILCKRVEKGVELVFFLIIYHVYLWWSLS